MAWRSRVAARGYSWPHVDEALPGADGIGADGHALDDGVGVALHHRPVQKGPGVALGAVADDKFHLARQLPDRSAICGRWGSRRRPGPASRTFHRVQNRLWSHLRQGPLQGSVTADGRISLQGLGIYSPQVAGYQGKFNLGHIVISIWVCGKF